MPRAKQASKPMLTLIRWLPRLILAGNQQQLQLQTMLNTLATTTINNKLQIQIPRRMISGSTELDSLMTIKAMTTMEEQDSMIRISNTMDRQSKSSMISTMEAKTMR